MVCDHFLDPFHGSGEDQLGRPAIRRSEPAADTDSIEVAGQVRLCFQGDHMESINRRGFLRESSRTVVSLAATAALVTPRRSRAASPNDVMRVAVVGFNGRG